MKECDQKKRINSVLAEEDVWPALLQPSDSIQKRVGLPGVRFVVSFSIPSPPPPFFLLSPPPGADSAKGVRWIHNGRDGYSHNMGFKNSRGHTTSGARRRGPVLSMLACGC
jgi:hypothetical protein